MFKRFNIIVIALLQVVLAHSAVGNWERFSSYTGGVSRLIDTPSKVYYLSNGYLYDYDKENDVTTSYTSSTQLSDNNVKYIRYNKEDKYLFIGYETGNIDILFDNGKIVNVPDIADAVISVDKVINNVHFENGKIYVATSFGVLIIDSKKFYVIDSGIYNQNVTAFFPINGALMVVAANNMYSIEEGKSIRSLEQFIKLHSVNVQSFVKVSKTKVAISGSTEAAVYNYSDPLKTDGYSVNHSTSLKNLGFFIESESGCYLNSSNTLWKVDVEKTTMVKDVALPAVTKSTVVSFWESVEDLWSGSDAGIANYSVNGSEVTVLQDRFKPMNSLSVAEPVVLCDNEVGNHIYVMNRGMVEFRVGNKTTSGRAVRQYADLFVDGKIIDVAGSGTKSYSQGTVFKDANGGTYPVNPQKIIEDPDDPDTYYLISGSEGVFKITNREIVGQYYTDNAPLTAPWGIMAYDGAIDKDGNLWIITKGAGTVYSCIVVLPSEYRKKNPAEVKIEDWKVYKRDDMTFTHEATLLVCRYSNRIFAFDTSWHGKLMVIDTKGTLSDTDDDEVFTVNNLVDQDGISNRPLYLLSIVEDREGKVWLGTTMGVFEISNPQNFTAQNATFNRIKVPRNDGSNFADYLLGSDWVMTMSVDNSNRKWIGTNESGLYLVSPSGDRIVESFTVDNSPLHTNQITSVLSDKMSNKVYVGTKDGLLCYSSDSSPVSENFDNVYAYPNPVRPEYTGWITITNLMDNSLVKIADSQGNVVYQTMSEGGMARWDGCTSNGSRVKTGVYYVFASSGGTDGGGSTGAVTKILVVN